MDAFRVEVEADIAGGLPKFDLVGLPDTAVSEARDRVRAAIKNNALKFPSSRITINLAPADIRKAGPLYDLPILIAILLASGQIPGRAAEDAAFIGELSLSGEIRPASGILPMVLKAAELGIKKIYIPSENSAEGTVASGIDVYPVRDLKQLLHHLRGEEPLSPCEKADFQSLLFDDGSLDFCDVRGQEEAKRALEIAAAGGHNVLMMGPPGSGKSMLAKRLPSILPPITYEESLETSKIYSIRGLLPPGQSLITARPFRAPHHSTSAIGLTGGGTIPHPGELSLAHNGVLFLDELPEFNRQAMECMRQPLEENFITISRAAGTLRFPCSVMLVAAMNPCPCGYFGHPTHPCICPDGAPARYLAKVSGPLLDRIDIHIEVPSVAFEQLNSPERAEPSAAIRARVSRARELQQRRLAGTGCSCNAKMDARATRETCRLTPDAEFMMRQAFDRLDLSARAYDKLLKIARTIADLDNSADIGMEHMAEAVQYRSLDRKLWQV